MEDDRRVHQSTQQRQRNRNESHGQQSVTMPQSQHDQQSPQQSRRDAGKVQKIKSLQAFENSAKDPQGKTERYSRSYYQKKKSSRAQEIPGNFENGGHVKRATECQHQSQYSHHAVACHGGVDQSV